LCCSCLAAYGQLNQAVYVYEALRSLINEREISEYFFLSRSVNALRIYYFELATPLS